MTKTYSSENPEVWDRTSNAAANFITLQAYMAKPKNQVLSDNLIGLIDEIQIHLEAAKTIILSRITR